MAGDVDVGGVVVQVAPGPAHTCAVLGDDEVPAAAGDVPLGSKVLQVATSWTTTCVVLIGGNVRCWGNGLPVAGPELLGSSLRASIAFIGDF